MVKIIQPAIDTQVVRMLADEAEKLAPKFLNDDIHAAALAAVTNHPEYRTPDNRSAPVYAAVVLELHRRKQASEALKHDVPPPPQARRGEGSFSANVSRWMEEDEEKRYENYRASLQEQPTPQQIVVAEGQLELGL